jgi:murein DD-endopeptidase MepM/ murein hydrolase activator NlpD
VLFVRLILSIWLVAFVAACATPSPRDPAQIDYRRANTSGPSPSVLNSAPRCDPGARYTVRSGDTLSEIAEDCGVSTSDLANANGLYPPYELLAGQELTFPRPSSHTVRRGENLYRIGLRYNINYLDLASHNGIGAPYAIEVGQEIRIPNGRVRTVSLEPPPVRTDRPRTNVTRETPVTVESADPPPRRDPPARTEPPASAGPVTFQWPIRGDIISTFGPKPDGRRNDGINIAANEGDSVRAAAGGTVVYAGGELQGYGELVLIRHDGGWVTAYAHNSRLLVAEGDRVDQGQLIAEAGSTGSVDTSQVHFEIRRGVTPEDPMGHLQGS